MSQKKQIIALKPKTIEKTLKKVAEKKVVPLYLPCFSKYKCSRQKSLRISFENQLKESNQSLSF
ncbi:hypothetical protein IW15_09740 [Chryseobacterium soli]|uniref:Uncharacterized protein n=1 Tax=Chryseobacterium soli TaxID=445961 RepID=A0A086A8M8_9FLAO|nr:hypothetical protein IW15_09740 [Chryseobacterium soli]